MTVKEILDSVLTREGLYKNIPNPFASTDLIVQENIRVLNELLEDIVHKNSLSELLKEVEFSTYSQWATGTLYNVGDIVYSGKYRYECMVAGTATDDPASLGLTPGNMGTGSDSITWKCLGDWNQYPFAMLAPDCAGVDTGTMVNMNQRVPMQAVNMHQWMVLKASSVAVGTTGIFTIRDKSIYIFPGLADGTKISFLYYTMLPVVASDGTTKAKFDNSTDTCLIPDQILLLGTVYRYLKDKDVGNWGEVEKEFDETLKQHEAQGQAPQQIDLAGGAMRNVSNYSDGNWYVG
jgi:hypothetical protein